MGESKTREPLPDDFQTLEAAADFWDTHSLADYWDETRDAQVEVRVRRRRRVALAPEVWKRISEEAAVRGVSLETLVNLWLMEKAREATPSTAEGASVAL